MLRTWAVLVAAAAALLLLPRVQALDFDADEHLDEEVARAAFRIAVSADGVQYTKEVGSLVLTESMNRAWWDLTSDVLEAFREKKIDLTSRVHQHARALKRQLTTFADTVSARKTSSRGISPAFQWAQSPEFLYLNVKFSAKWDTRKRFELKLELFGDVQLEGSTWSMQSVGRASLTIKKAAAGVWPRLLQGKAKPGNLHVWWTMKDRHDKENSNFSATNKRPTPAPDAAKADAPEPTPAAEATPSASPTPTPTQDPLTAALADLSSKHRVALDAISAERKAAVTKLEEAAKAAKAALDQEVEDKKAAIDKQLEEDRKEVDASISARRTELREKHVKERLAVRAEHGAKEDL